ncbi:hypothetical protein GE09DRAFT_29274 [Coniochaeta sp. 2T2.1]|nr:hypothetical protein GE09DRAFT_29274 [Coniochaeta sp. 2T2.1]
MVCHHHHHHHQQLEWKTICCSFSRSKIKWRDRNPDPDRKCLQLHPQTSSGENAYGRGESPAKLGSERPSGGGVAGDVSQWQVMDTTEATPTWYYLRCHWFAGAVKRMRPAAMLQVNGRWFLLIVEFVRKPESVRQGGENSQSISVTERNFPIMFFFFSSSNKLHLPRAVSSNQQTSIRAEGTIVRSLHHTGLPQYLGKHSATRLHPRYSPTIGSSRFKGDGLPPSLHQVRDQQSVERSSIATFPAEIVVSNI